MHEAGGSEMLRMQIAKYGCGWGRAILDGPGKDLISTVHCLERGEVDEEDCSRIHGLTGQGKDECYEESLCNDKGIRV